MGSRSSPVWRSAAGRFAGSICWPPSKIVFQEFDQAGFRVEVRGFDRRSQGALFARQCPGVAGFPGARLGRVAEAVDFDRRRPRRRPARRARSPRRPARQGGDQAASVGGGTGNCVFLIGTRSNVLAAVGRPFEYCEAVRLLETQAAHALYLAEAPGRGVASTQRPRARARSRRNGASKRQERDPSRSASRASAARAGLGLARGVGLGEPQRRPGGPRPGPRRRRSTLRPPPGRGETRAVRVRVGRSVRTDPRGCSQPLRRERPRGARRGRAKRSSPRPPDGVALPPLRAGRPAPRRAWRRSDGDGPARSRGHRGRGRRRRDPGVASRRRSPCRLSCRRSRRPRRPGKSRA